MPVRTDTIWDIIVLNFLPNIYVIADTAKDDIIKKVYYSDDIGFGSIASTYREANKQYPGITLQNAQDWMNKKT